MQNIDIPLDSVSEIIQRENEAEVVLKESDSVDSSREAPYQVNTSLRINTT